MSNIDRFIAALPAEADSDLMLCPAYGIAYQVDRDFIIKYDDAYYNKCVSYEDKEIARKINAGRIRLVNRRMGQNRVVDVGIGSGEFIKNRKNTFGFDVNPVAMEWLKRNDLWAQRIEDFGAMTFWDVLEHVPDPEMYLRKVHLHGFLFTSIPIFDDLKAIRKSRHYRPGEHLYYFTEAGFVGWMRKHGFLLLERADFETRAGRDSILSFAFKRIAWPAKE